ncbi:MAG: serine--tRNA ligase [Candidatus Thermoplasmatota archaeon]|nr:serine--tRNA ligase [Candidatus Thermoplasmatota archaeon]|tara:strand:+ start:910 stop:2190 length:1281 start_codon:yes stop_codon:yes gene_type:complete
MLDIQIFRDDPGRIRADFSKRGIDGSIIDEVLLLDDRWREVRFEVDQLRKSRNSAARMISEAKKKGDEGEVKSILGEVSNLGSKIESLEEEAERLISKRDSIRMQIPNLLHEAVPTGENDQKNVEISRHGEFPIFNFEPKTHNELIEMNRWVDLPRAGKITGSRQYFLMGDLARLEMALQQYSADFLIDRGYTLVQPPLMMNRKAYEGVTDLSDFETVMYGIEPDGYYLIATSEHPLTAMMMDEVIEPANLPIKMVGVSPCFRREVGAHGMSDRGIWRVHQFTKVEQVIICKPEESWGYHTELLGNAKDLWDSLGLHYRVVDICTGDIGTVASRKYDLEAWLPGAGEFKEVVSCSNCTDYQANRLKMRYRKSGGNEAVHTLNSTAVATSRALVAIIEQYQTNNGAVIVPDVLIPWMRGKKILEPNQ